MKRILGLIWRVLLGLIFILAGFFFLRINDPQFQTNLTHGITSFLSKRLNATVKIDSVNIEFFNRLNLYGVLVKDQFNDTILSCEKPEVQLSVFDLLHKKFTIDKITLRNTYAYLHKPISTDEFTFKFLIDALRDTTGKKKSKVELNLRNLSLEQIHFVLLDEPNNVKLDFSIPETEVDVHRLDINTPVFDLNEIVFRNADLKVNKLIPVLNDSNIFSEPDTAIVHINTQPLQLFVTSLRFEHCRFQYDDLKEASVDNRFDGFHQLYENFDMTIKNGSMVLDTIKAFIADISFREKSGFVLNHLQTNVRITPTYASASELKFETPYSTAGNYFAMRYTNFHAFLDYNASVLMETDLQQAHIALNDVGYFIPQLKNEKPLVVANGKLNGTVENIRSKNFKIAAGELTRFEGTIDIKGLPDIENTFINLGVNNLKTNVSDLHYLAPLVEFPPSFSKLEVMNFNGSFTGFIHDFVAYGSLGTALGGVNSDLNMKFTNNYVAASYSGHLAADQFQIGSYVGADSLIGAISFDAQVNGAGLSVDDVDASMKGTISSFEFNDYNYRNIGIDGEFQRRLFSGNLKVDDKNISLAFRGTVDFNDSLPVYNFSSAIREAHLHELGFSDREFIMNSILETELVGRNIDDMAGELHTSGTSFSLDQDSFFISKILLNLQQHGMSRTIQLISPVVDASVQGRVALTQLHRSFFGFLENYFPSLPIKYQPATVAQDFDFDVHVKDAGDFLSFFFPEWGGLSGSTLKGHFNSQQQILLLTSTIPEVSHNNVRLTTIASTASTGKQTFLFSTKANKLNLNDTLSISTPAFSVSVKSDTALFFASTDSTVENYRIKAEVQVSGNTNGVLVHLLPSAIVLNGDAWVCDNQNQFQYASKKLAFGHFIFTNAERSVELVNLNDDQSPTSLRFNFDSFPIEDVYNFIPLSAIQLRGTLDGSIDVLNVFYDRRFQANAEIKKLHVNDEVLDRITADINYNPKEDKVTVNAQLRDDRYDVRATGFYLPRDKKNQLQFEGDVVRFDLKFFESAFLQDYISNTKGWAGGKLYLTGTTTQPLLNGEMTVSNLETTIDYLQTTYTVQNQKIKLADGFIDIGRMKIKDANNDTAIATGKIYHDHLRHFNFDVAVRSSLVQVLNTTSKDNSLYYGVAEAGGIIQFKGPLQNMEIRAALTSRRGTTVAIPVDYSTSVTGGDFIHFVSHSAGSSGAKTSTINKPSGLKVYLDLDITPEAVIQIIFDVKTGDIVTGTGSGALRLEVALDGEFNMYGTYTVNKGTYLYTFQNFFNKFFNLEKGGTVTWTGDPYGATVNFSAVYSTQAIVADLVQGSGIVFSESDLKELQQRVPVDVYLKLTGLLFQPDVSFQIDLPDVTSLSSVASQQLQRVEQDPNELNKQVFGLLLLNRFLPESAGLGNQSLQTDVNNSVSEFLLNQLSYWTSQIRPDINFNFNYSSVESNLNATNPNDITKYNELQVMFTKKLFNDRVAVDIGGNFDFSSPAASSGSVPANSNNFAGDFAIDYKLTEDGKVTAKAFSKSQYDIVDERYKTKNGISLSYKKEFDRLKELFQRDPNKPKKGS